MNATIETSSKAVWDHLSKIMARGYSHDKVFHDWLDLMLYSLQRRDPEYLEIVGRYRNNAAHGNREIDFFASAMGELMVQMQRHCTDILGYLYTIEITRGEHGQFFTPESVCELMARMIMSEPSDERINISDPCCGSGRMLIEAQKVHPKAIFIGTDIDPRCAKMTVLNMLFRNADSYIIHGNTLSLEVFGAWKTRSTFMGGEVLEWPKDRLDEMKQLLEMPLIKRQDDKPESYSIPVIALITEQMELL